jgi:hypothetical protein
MRRKTRIAALTASLATVLSGGLMATMASAGAASASTGPSVHTINLHDARKAALARGIQLHKKIIMPPRGTHKAKAKAAGCVEPDCNLVSGGGPVQHNPKVYLLLEGPDWGSGGIITDPAGQYLDSLYSGLGTPSDTWSLSTSQYTDSTGHPVFSGSVLAGVWQDTSTPPVQDQSTLSAEADAFASQQGISGNDAQIVIASQPGTQFADGFGSQYCAYHTYSSVPFTNLPYVLDAGQSCGENFVNAGSAGTYDGFSIVGGHEYGETVSDPLPTSGWFDGNDFVSGGENGDKCAWGGLGWGDNDPYGNVSLSTGSFAMQSLWSNKVTGCVMSDTVTAYAHNPVSHLAATARYTNITATWDVSANATSYKVIVTLRGTTTRVGKSIVTTPYYHLGSLHRGTRYTVRVLARPAGPSAPYASVNITTRS